MATVQPVTDENHFTTLTSALPPQTLQIRYFHAPWAAPCTQMSSILSALASTYTSPTTSPSFQSIDAEELPELAESHEVTAVPFVVLIRDGRTLETISGVDANKLRTAVEKHQSPQSGAQTNGTTLPPAQQVTRPKEQPLAPGPAKINGSAQPQVTTGVTSGATPTTSTQTTDDAPTKTEEKTQQSMHDRLTQLTTAAPVMLFMKGTPSAPQCGFSRQLVGILREHSVRYGFFNILADEDVRQGLKEFADWPTFPQLWMSGELVGGLDIVREELAGDENFFGEYSVAGKT